MKRHFLAWVVAVLIIMSAGDAPVAAALVRYVGVDTTSAQGWLDTRKAKPNDQGGTNSYGSDGFVLFEWKRANWDWSASQASKNLTFLPSYISSVTHNFAYGYRNDTVYGQLNDVEVSGANHAGALLSGAGWSGNTMTIVRNGTTASTFTLTVASCYDVAANGPMQVWVSSGGAQVRGDLPFAAGKTQYISFQIGPGSTNIDLVFYGTTTCVSAVLFDGLSAQSYPRTDPTIDTAPSPVTAPGADAPWVIFEIDEGYVDSLVNRFRDGWDGYLGLEARLSKIYTSLYALAGVYNVAVLIYPTHLYDANAWGKSNPVAYDTLHPGLLRTLDFFNARGGSNKIKVFFEMYSTGIVTNQNGHLASLAKPPLYFANRSTDHRAGLSMDVNALAAARSAYPNVLVGARFHEIYGADAAERLMGPNYRFTVDAELMNAVIATCGTSGMKLIWNDSSWLNKAPGTDNQTYGFVYSTSNPPYYESRGGYQGTPDYVAIQNNAESTLGSNMCFMIEKNNYHPTSILEYYSSVVGGSLPSWDHFNLTHYTSHPVKSRASARWGMSIQNWFWGEVSNTLCGRYELRGDMVCPVEILGMYIQQCLREGAKYLEFESTEYYWNCEFSPITTPGFAGYTEGAADFSERLNMKRLKDYLLNYNTATTFPDPKLSNTFDANQQAFIENRIDVSAKNYHQATLGVKWTSAASNFFDFYNDGRSWVQQDANRLPSGVLAGTIDAATRADFNGDGVDELIVVRSLAGTRQAQFYNAWHGLMQSDSALVADNAEGTFKGLVAANLIAATLSAGGVVCDPDELIVIRQSGSTLNLRVYQQTANDGLTQITYSALGDSGNSTQVNAISNATMRSATNFQGACALRNATGRWASGQSQPQYSRLLDRIVFLHKNTYLEVRHLTGGVEKKTNLPVGTVNLSGKAIGCGLNADHAQYDELALVRQPASGTSIIDLYATGDSYKLLGSYPLGTTAEAITHLIGGAKSIPYTIANGQSQPAAPHDANHADWESHANGATPGQVDLQQGSATATIPTITQTYASDGFQALKTTVNSGSGSGTNKAVVQFWPAWQAANATTTHMEFAIRAPAGLVYRVAMQENGGWSYHTSPALTHAVNNGWQTVAVPLASFTPVPNMTTLAQNGRSLGTMKLEVLGYGAGGVAGISGTVYLDHVRLRARPPMAAPYQLTHLNWESSTNGATVGQVDYQGGGATATTPLVTRTQSRQGYQAVASTVYSGPASGWNKASYEFWPSWKSVNPKASTIRYAIRAPQNLVYQLHIQRRIGGTFAYYDGPVMVHTRNNDWEDVAMSTALFNMDLSWLQGQSGELGTVLVDVLGYGAGGNAGISGSVYIDAVEFVQ